MLIPMIYGIRQIGRRMEGAVTDILLMGTRMKVMMKLLFPEIIMKIVSGLLLMKMIMKVIMELLLQESTMMAMTAMTETTMEAAMQIATKVAMP